MHPDEAPVADPRIEAIDTLFIYHPPTPEQVDKYRRIRDAAKALAFVILAECDGGPDRTAAIRKVREAVMTANASIATHNAAANLR